MNGQKVLVIDDDVDINELICAVLENDGFETMSAFDGDDGLQKTIEFMPDIVLLDVMMPHMDGIDVCRAIRGREATRDIPIIMVTAKTGLSDKLAGYINGANRYIVKPFDLEHLLDEVIAALRQHKATHELGLQENI